MSTNLPKIRLSAQLLFVFTIFFMPGQWSWAQSKAFSTLDLPRIQREINLMETILAEMLSNGYRLSQPFRDSRVRGIYVPDVGIIIRASTSPHITSMQYYLRSGSDEKRKKNTGVYVLGPGGEVSKAKAASYRALIDSTAYEFLEYYADASGQLAEQEQVIIVYEPGPYLSAFNLQGEEKHPLGTATFSVKKGDISDLRGRKLSRDQFVRKVIVADSQKNKSANQRLRRFASVCKAMLNDDEQSGYRIYGEISSLFLEDFGAIYLFDAVQAVQTPHNIILRIQDEIRRQEMVVQQLSEIAQKSQDDRDINEMLTKLQAESDAKRDEKLKKAYEQFERGIIEIMLSYGRSLQMLDGDQKLTIAIKLLDNTSIVPERVVFQSKKDDLNAFDAGKIDRKAMLERVTIKRYGAHMP